MSKGKRLGTNVLIPHWPPVDPYPVSS